MSTETREHTTSYYAATANWKTDYPTLIGNHTTDICVIGGGFSGVSTALHLAEKGYQVTLVEANRIGWGASGRNGGHVNSGIGEIPVESLKKEVGESGMKMLFDAGYECVEIVKERVEKYQIDCHLKFGYIFSGTKNRHLKKLHGIKDYLEHHGYPYALTIADKTQTQAIARSPIYQHALINEFGWGHVHPLNLCIGEARAAQQLGATLFEQSRIEKIEYLDNPTVHTNQGSITANALVLCGEAYLGGLVPELNHRLIPFMDFVVATEPLGEHAQTVLSKPWAATDANHCFHYYRLTHDQRLLFGGRRHGNGTIPKNAEAFYRKEISSVFPHLNNVKIDYLWSGQMGLSARLMPQVGRLRNNVYYVQGYTGNGVAPTHLMGKILAEAVSGTLERFDVFAKIQPMAIPGSPWAKHAALRLAILYYQLLDCL